MKPFQIWVSTIILMLYTINIYAQLPKCGSPPIMENDCSDACVVCDLDGLTLQNGHTIPGIAPPGYCTQVVHSIRYIAFVAGSTTLGFSVTVNSCTLGSAIELGVYETANCSNFNLVSNCNTFMPRNGTYQFTATGLKIGCHYYIVIDGNGPAICNFTIKVTSGSAKAPTPQIGIIEGPKKFCIGEVADYTLSNYSGACEYEWTATNGNILSSNSNKVTIEWNVKGKGQICFIAKNACNSSQKCINVEIGDASPPEIINALICENGSYLFKGTSYGIGDYEFKLKNHFGCDSTLELHIEALVENRVDKDSIICYPDCILHNGNSYCIDGNYPLIQKSKKSPYCDSITDLNLKVLRIEPKIYQLGKISCSNNIVSLHSDSSIVSNNGKIIKRWLDANNKIIDTSSSIQVDSAGKYKLIITLIHASGKKCESYVEYDLIGNSKTPDIVDIPEIKSCEGSYFYFDNINIVDKNSTNSNYKFYRTQPFDSTNELKDSVFINANMKLFLVADNLGCTDTSEIQLNSVSKISSEIITPTFCKGDSIQLKNIQINYSSPIDSQGNIYTCKDLDSNCILNFPILADTSFNVYTVAKKDGCSNYSDGIIKVSALPLSEITLDKNIYCSTEDIIAKFNSLKNKENRTLIVNQKDSFAIQNDNFNIGKFPKGKHQLDIITKNEYCVSSSTILFNVVSPDTLPIIRCRSNDSSITFFWSNNGIRNPIIYNSNHTDKISLSSSDSVVYSNLNSGTKIKFELTIKDSICGDQITETECEAIICPNFKIDIIGRDSFCIDKDGKLIIDFSALVEKPDNDFKARWSGIGIIDSIEGIFDFSNLPNGKKIIKYTYYKGPCKTEVSKEIWIRRSPLARFIIDDKVCQDSLIKINFQGKDTLDDILSWNLKGAQILTNKLNKEIIVQWQQAGKKRITLNVKNNLCEDDLEKEIEVIANPEKPEIECITQDSNIIFRWKKESNAERINYVLPQGLNNIKLNDTSLLINQLIPGQKIKINLITKGKQPCGDIMNELECETKICPPMKLLIQDTLTHCIHNNIDEIDLQKYIDKNIPLIWESQRINDHKFNLKNIVSGEYCIPVKANFDYCKYSDTFCIRIGESPEPEFIVKSIYCPEDEEKGRIEIIDIKKGAKPIKLYWNNQEWNGNPITQINQGSYDLIAKDKYGCKSDSTLTIIQSDSISVSAGPDLEIEKGNSIQLNSTVRGIISDILWSPTYFLNCINCNNPITKPDNNIEYIVTIVDTNGCTDIDTISIRVRDSRVFAPNVFSPNGDGVNDYFTIFGTSDVSQINYLNIYDRWGELVFSKSNFPHNIETEGWDGTFRSQKLNPGVYIYTGSVTFWNGQKEEVKGEVTVLR